MFQTVDLSDFSQVHDLKLDRTHYYNTVEWWNQFITNEEYNLIKESDKDSIRLLFEGFEVALKALNIKGIDEVARNADGKFWGYGPYFKYGKGLIRTKYGDDLLSDTQCQKGLSALTSYWDAVIHERKNIFESDIPFLGYRFAASGWPIDGAPSFNMRKKATVIYTLDDYLNQGTITESQRQSLHNAVKNRKNILVIGATKSGKTTFANALLHEISLVDPTCRSAIIEENSKELQCSTLDTIQLLVPPFKIDDKNGSITAGDLLKGILRRSPDRISLGEVRDGAAVYLLQAWNSGHSGGICTIHADSAIGGLRKFETYLEVGGWKVSKEMISENIHVVVSIQNRSEIHDGRYIRVRRVEEIKAVQKFKNGVSEDYKFDPL